MLIEKTRFTVVVGVLVLFLGGMGALIANGQDAVEEGDRTARVFAVRNVEGLLDQAEDEVDTQKRKGMVDRAREVIRHYLVDPEQSDVYMWKVAGRVALFEGDDDLAAFAFEAIGRLRPDYGKDEELRDLMVELSARPIDEKVKAIPAEREALVELMQSSEADENNRGDTRYQIGHSYDNGIGVLQNYVEAVKWYQRAAAVGSPIAMYHLGIMYANGRGVVKDHTEEARWYFKAAKGGCVEAMSPLGTLYDGGIGVSMDHAEAAKWYRKAAEGGDALAMNNVVDPIKQHLQAESIVFTPNTKDFINTVFRVSTPKKYDDIVQSRSFDITPQDTGIVPTTPSTAETILSTFANKFWLSNARAYARDTAAVYLQFGDIHDDPTFDLNKVFAGKNLDKFSNEIQTRYLTGAYEGIKSERELAITMRRDQVYDNNQEVIRSAGHGQRLFAVLLVGLANITTVLMMMFVIISPCIFIYRICTRRQGELRRRWWWFGRVLRRG